MNEKTIYQQFKEIELDEERQRDAAISSIKAIHAQGGREFHGDKPNGTYMGGNEKRFSRSGRFLGWYRDGQRRGKPNQKMPIQQYLEKLFERFKRSIFAIYPKSITGSVLAKRSAEARKEHGLSSQILDVHKALISQGVPKHKQAKKIAQQLGCNVEYVRRVIREIKNQ